MKNNMRIFLLVMLISLMFSACASTERSEFPQFEDPSPETYINLMPTIREYFYFRKQAVLTGKIVSFYKKYPDLAFDINLEQGINTEANLVTSMQRLKPFDANIFPEYYERIKIDKSDDEIQVLVHGMELYLWQSVDNPFNESGGEFKIVLFLHPIGNSWQVYKTDEVTLQEWKRVR